MEFKKDIEIHPGERVDFLMKNGSRIIQAPGKFCFGMDAVLLADFVSVRKQERVLELGAGSGVIPLLLVGWGKASAVDGLEIQPQLADMANRSAALNGLESYINIKTGDLRNAEYYFRKNSYEVVVCNPPYIPRRAGVANKDEAVAIAKQEICCILDDVTASAARMLRGQGRLAMIYKPERLNALICSLNKNRLIPKRIRMVHSRAGEEAELVLVEAQKAGKEGLTVLPPLIVYDENNKYSREMKAIYRDLGCGEG